MFEQFIPIEFLGFFSWLPDNSDAITFNDSVGCGKNLIK